MLGKNRIDLLDGGTPCWFLWAGGDKSTGKNRELLGGKKVKMQNDKDKS